MFLKFINVASASYLGHRGFQNSVGELTSKGYCSWCFRVQR